MNLKKHAPHTGPGKLRSGSSKKQATQIDVPSALSRATFGAMRNWPRHEGRETWIREDFLPNLAVAGLAIVEVGELQRRDAKAEAWRMRCRVDAEQVRESGLNRVVFYRWCETAEAHVATQLARELGFDGGKEPTPRKWAMLINKVSPTPADSQRLLDEIIAAGNSRRT